MTQGRKGLTPPTPVIKANTQNMLSNSNGQKGRVGLGVMEEQNKSHELFSGHGILNLCSKTNS